MSSALLSALFEFEQLPVPAGVCELDGTIVAVNPPGERLLARPAGELVGKKSWDFAPGVEHIWPEIIRGIHDRPDGVRGDITLATPEGSRAIHYLAGLRRVEGRALIILFAVPRDPSVEAARAAESHGKQRLEALGLVAGGIAHDFNNQLTSVLAEASAAREHNDLGAPATEALRRIEAAANRMAQLTRQLLAYAGRGRFVTEVMDPDQLLRDAQDQLSQIVGAGGELVVVPGGGRVAIEADRGLLLQVLGNLVANASEAQVAHGPIEITTTASSRSDGTRWWELQIRDRGAGMDPDTIARIWDPFFTTKPNHHGLGLSAVVGIVRRLGGEIHVESRPGAGSTFTLRLPLAAGAPSQSQPRDAAAGTKSVSLEGLRALIADDEPSVRTTIRRLLERRRATVTAAADGGEARARLHDGTYDFIVLDVMMPGMTGYQLLPIARQTNPGARVMLMSGYTDVARVDGEVEPDLFLEKPFTAKSFDDAIDTLLR